jgi:hypothetical protein
MVVHLYLEGLYMLSTAFASVSRTQRERGLHAGNRPAHTGGSREKRILRARHELG